MRPLVILLVSALTVALPRGQVRGEPLPGLLDVEGVVGNEPGLDDVEFEAATARQIPIAADIGELRIPFKLGKAKTLTLTLVWNDGSQTEILFLAADAKYQKKVPGDNFRSVEQRLPGACLEIPALGISYHTRPNPSFYREAALKGVRAKWASLPNVADHLFLLSIRVEGGGAALSLDGNYVGSIPKTNPLTAVVFPLSEETKVERLLRKKWTPWLPLDIRTLNRPGVMKGAVLSINQDSLNAHDAPIRVANGSLNADVGTVRDVSPPVNMDDSIYRYLERSAFEGLPEALLISVPSAPYTRA
ncbi:MAG: hypothetical protein O3B01_07150 [Planctomycetota bacterium]|nr:hypothetical protein [Planctomycetota bacterium]MDA1138345.1 hypothetical protein [Planctomycetota bacterium]